MLSSGDNKLKYTTLMLMIRNNRPYPDSLLAYFAGMDLYRYELYGDLRRMGKSALFPQRFNEHVAIAKSQLYNLQSYSRPDSISYIDRLKTTINGREGYVYFFRYRENKDDAAWKLATAGLIPLDESNYYFEDFRESTGSASQQYLNRENAFRYALSAFTQTRIKESEPLLPQLEKELKKIVFASKKSGRGFFQDNTDVLSSLDFSY
jgi:hypothetical protein